MSLTPEMMPLWELRELVKQQADTITALRAEVERIRSMTVVQESLIRKHEAALNLADAARMRGVIDNLNDEVERLRAEAKANLDLAERHMDEKHKLRAVLTWIDLQRYTDRGTINPDNAFEKAGELNKRIIEIMDRATAVLKEQT